MQTLFQDKMKNILYVIIINVLISIIYIKFTFKKYSYTGLTLREPDVFFIIISLIILTINTLFLPKYIDSISKIFIFFSFVIIICPTIILSNFVISLDSQKNMLQCFFSLDLCWVVIALSCNMSKNVRIKLPSFNSYKQFEIFILFLLTLSMAIVLFNFNVNLDIVFKLKEYALLYDVRSAYRENILEASGISVYLFSWAAKVINPIFFIYYYKKKNRIAVLLSILFQFLLFSISGHKSIILGLFVIFLVKYVLDIGINVQKILFIIMIVIFTFSLFEYYGISAFNDIVVRRTMMTPGILTNYYIEYYSSHEFAKSSYNVIGSIFDLQKQPRPAFVIGDYYFGRSAMSANANIFASAFSDFGIIGMFLTTSIIIVLMNFVDLLIKNKNKILSMSCLILPTWSFFDTNFLTTLMTHGFLVGIILVILIPNIKEVYTSE